jgi:tetrahydromethanopterin S-methyltransferase subunit A
MTDKAKVTIDQIIAAIEADDNLGFCLACGAEAYPFVHS